MACDLLQTLALVLAPPTILLLALNIPSISHRNPLTKALSVLAVAASAARVITTVNITNPSLAFMAGLLEGWIVIWAAVLLVRHNVIAEARRRRWSKVARRDGEFEEGGLVWQRYPRGDWVARLAWSLDLLVSFRGVGWRFGESDERKAKSPTPDATPRKSDGIYGVFSAIFRLLRDVLAFQAVLWMSSQLQASAEKAPWQSQALDTVTWIGTSVPFINFCHSAWSLIGELQQRISPSESFHPQQYNPSPWGPVGAVIEHGLAGLWGATWHNYFKFGLQSTSDLLIPPTTNPRLKPLVRLARMFCSFLLSGVIHFCGSYMLPGPTQPSKEFSFFLLQGVAVVLQVLVYDQVVDKRVRRVLNPVLVAAWLYWTESLIFEDQRRGGMWN